MPRCGNDAARKSSSDFLRVPVESSPTRVATSALRLKVARLEPSAVRPCPAVSERQRVVERRRLPTDSAPRSRSQHRSSSTTMLMTTWSESVLGTTRARRRATAGKAGSHAPAAAHRSLTCGTPRLQFIMGRLGMTGGPLERASPEVGPEGPRSGAGRGISGLPSLGGLVRWSWQGPRMWMYLAIAAGVVLVLNVLLVVVLAVANRHAEIRDERGR